MGRSFIAVLMIMTACTTTKDDRICLEWSYKQYQQQKCVPLYGNFICADELVTKYQCILYEEPREGENTLHQRAPS